MSAHTPGQWRVSGCQFGSKMLIEHGDENTLSPIIGSVYSDEGRLPQAANARLIVAAPDLLAALIEVRNMIPYSRSNGIIAECRHCEGGAVSVEGGKRVPHTDACVISRIDAAIDRATGAA